MYLHPPVKRDQLGFSVIEVLLVVLVVAALAVTGLVVYQHNKPSNTKNSAATQPRNTTTTQPAQATTQYLTIKEWGVKLPLSNSIKDAYYTVKDSNTSEDGLPNTAWLGLASLSNSDCDASKIGTPGATANSDIGALGRALPTDHEPVQGTLYTQLYPGVTIGGYYYFYISDIKGKTCAPTTTLQSINSAFAPAAKNIVPATQYLDIKEWGIKIKLADADKVTYTLGGNPNGSSANADGIVSWATLKLNNSVSTSDKCKALGYEAEQLTAATNATKIGKYDYGFSGTYNPCGNSTVDTLRDKITSTELVNSAITAE